MLLTAEVFFGNS